MFKFFKNRNKETSDDIEYLDDPYFPKGYDEEKVKVFYEGEVLSPEYTARTLVLNEGSDIRENFNEQELYCRVIPDYAPMGSGDQEEIFEIIEED